MGLKQIINRNKILLNGVVNRVVTIPEEPLIYSIKFDCGNRRLPGQYFRNKDFRTFVKCCLPAYKLANTPVVLIVTFFVTPPPGKGKIAKARLKAEDEPAVYGWELCDYLLSFMELLYPEMITSYKQICKIEMEKKYSDNPRTEFKFMRYDHYKKVCSNDPIHPDPEAINPLSKKGRKYKAGLIPADEQRDAHDAAVFKKLNEGNSTFNRPSDRYPTFSDTGECEAETAHKAES